MALFDNKNYSLQLIEGKGYFEDEYKNHHARGNYFLDVGNHENAMEAYLKAMEANEKDKKQLITEKQTIDRTLIAEVGLLNNMAAIYSLLYNIDKNIEYKLLAIKIMDENPTVNFQKLKYGVPGNLADVYLYNKQFEKAFPILEKAEQWDVNTLTNYYGALLKSSDDLVELLKNLLNWSLMQSGRNRYNPTMFNLVAALQPDINIVRNMAERKNIAFKTQLPATAPFTADEDMLKTIVRNLLANAVKFTEPGGTVTLAVAPCDGKDAPLYVSTKYTISITDTGVGMSEAQMNKLFKLDSAVSQSGTAGEHGTGLGLIVCKEMLEKHGSKLHIESEIGKGSKFWFFCG